MDFPQSGGRGGKTKKSCNLQVGLDAEGGSVVGGGGGWKSPERMRLRTTVEPSPDSTRS